MPPTGASQAPARRPGRWAAAVALGAGALLVNRVSVPLLTAETPEFLFGGALVLVAFVRLGAGPGALTALLSLVEFLARGDVAGLATLIYGVEAAAAAWAGRRTRSLVLAVLLFWLGVGWAIDLAVYRGALGLSGAYVGLLLVKQLLNGLLNALAAEVILYLLRRRAAERGATVELRAYVLGRLLFMAMLPATLLALVYTRTAYADRIARTQVRQQRAVRGAAVAMSTYLGRRRDELAATAGRVAVTRALGDRSSSPALLSALHREAPGYVEVALTDAEGRIVASIPDTTAEGRPAVGLSVADRAYFAEARAERRTASPALDRPRARAPGAGGLILVIAEPVLDASGRFDGIVYGALDRRAFLPLLEQGREGPAELMTLLDERRRVLVSQDPRLSPGMALAPLVPPNALTGGVARNFEWMPPRDSSFGSRLGLDLRHGAYQPVVMTRLAVLGDLPASELHAAMAPAVGQILGFLVLTAAALLLTVAFLVRRLAQPLLAANDVATDIADGRLGGGADLDALRSSPVHEVRALASHLDTMRRALAERQAVSVAREHELEQQLLHAQKMEAIGRLAGGVAHDFNNLLTPILSYSDLVLADLPGDHPVRDDVAQIRASAERARGLTRQLLTFGRKQMLEMRVVDLAGEVRDFERLLRPLVRENVELRVQTATGGGCVRADVAQVEQLLMNLVVNAVDAMPDGGVLTVAVERGTMAGGRPALALVVRDTGHGMDATTRAHAFEPFFTTKERGKGTGLGLATVYGIVKQHGGEITLDSAPGAGTTFRVALPLIAEAAESPAPQASASPVRGGAETIMVVEDEPAVRSLVCTILRRHGYDVIDAEGPDDAVRRSADAGCRIDLLLTDVMMPRMNGRELYERIQPLRPGLRVLYMSGYTGDVIASQGVLEEATHVLHKPFTVDGLTAKVRRVLGAAGTAA